MSKPVALPIPKCRHRVAKVHCVQCKAYVERMKKARANRLPHNSTQLLTEYTWRCICGVDNRSDSSSCPMCGRDK